MSADLITIVCCKLSHSVSFYQRASHFQRILCTVHDVPENNGSVAQQGPFGCPDSPQGLLDVKDHQEQVVLVASQRTCVDVL